MLQERARFGPRLDPEAVLPAAGLCAADADLRVPVQVVSTGVAQVLVPLAAEQALARARPDWPAIEALLDEHEAIVLYLAYCDLDVGRARTRAFTHSADMGEDPATGSAAGPLAAYLHARTGVAQLEVRQGEEMGRPSRLECAIDGDRVRVGGGVAVVLDGTVRLP
ncbi:MAG: PhzF family phenazine biosynthesis protein, partial [Actinomycetota bacterium]|nr:PhzF family phenazine biosynthesis protein [Actinomycetota bacterium]